MKLLTKVNFNINTEEANKFCKFDFDPVPEIIEEHLKLSGWVVGIESPAVGIELIQDGQLVREVPLTIDRPLTNQIYATFPGAEQSGFTIDTTLEKINVESVHILIQAVLDNFQRVPLATLDVLYEDEENIQDLAQTKAELYETREELEQLQSQFDEVLAELAQAHLQLHQTEQTQSEKGISTNLEEKIKQETIASKPKLAHHLINNKLLLSVSPRAGHRTVSNLIEVLTKNKNITYERIRDLETIYSLKNVKKIKFVRNPYERAVSSYLVCCEHTTLKLWHGIGLTEQQSKQLTFENFIEILKKKDVFKLNHHLSNQVEIGEGEKFNYDEVRKIENIQQEIKGIFQQEGIEVDLASFMKIGVRRKKQIGEKCYSIPFQKLQEESRNDSSSWPDYEFFYNAELTEAVAKIYETDLYDYPLLESMEEQQELEPQEESKTDKVILCAIAKNEAAYLVEWIAYHKFVVGFDEVLIYENDSRDHSKLILEKLDKLGICKYKRWPRSKGVVPQRSAYNDAIQTQNQFYEWVCFLDLDEFLVLKNFNSIHDCIRSFNNKADSIVVNWLMFGSSGESNYKPEPVTQRFTKCANHSNPIHKHMKSISRIDSIEFLDIHIPRLKPNSRYFHVDGTELHFGANPTLEHINEQGYINHRPAQINHYQSKSLEEYKCRKLKGRATVDERSPQSHLKPGDFERLNSYCNQIDNIDILSTVSQLNHKIDSIYQALGIQEKYPDQFKEFIHLEAARYDNLVRRSAPNQMEQTQSKTAISTNVEQKMIKENDSEKPNKVFGIGLAKTGTTSLARAMKILGYSSKHYLLNPAVDILKYEFLGDMPIQTRYKKYDQKYPGSKFILTVRDQESWLRSCMNQFHRSVRKKGSLPYKYWVEQFGFYGYDEESFIIKYEQHINDVKEYFKDRKDDLLIFDVCSGESWDKLCAFLGEEIPEQPFPQENISKGKSLAVTQAVSNREADHFTAKTKYDTLAKHPTPINKSTMPKISRVPLWAPEAVGKISEFLMGRPKAKILEFGSGGSTIWLSSYDVDLISIEHDQTWFSALQSKLDEQKISNVRLLYREKPYFNIAYEFPDHYFDLILVDGRDRNECIKASLKKVKNGGLLVLDDAQRTRYRMGRSLLEAFPSVRYHHPHRYTQIWFIRHDLNCRALAVDNPFENPSKTVSSKVQTQEQLPKPKQAVSTGNPRENERFLYYKTILINLLDIPNKKGLEIGAFDRPFITPREGQIDYSDYRNTVELKQLAQNAVGHDPKFVVDVTYDLKQISLSDIPQKYDYIIASHVLEHTPNMIGFLNNIAHLLTDNGFAFLMIPDKRYTFDCLKPLTTLGELLENHFNSLDKPNFRQVFNGYYYNRPINASDVWSGKIQDSQSLSRVPRDLKEIISKALQSKESYIDSHCNIFTDVHFEDVISELIQGGLLNFSKAEVHKIQPGFLDFLCILHK